jgi:arginase
LIDVALIQVPYMLGDERHGAAAGPGRYLEGGATELLRSKGVGVAVERVERRGRAPFPDAPAASLAVNIELAEVVRRAVATARLPLVLAGSCDASLGVLAGFDHAHCGVVWIDAHADFNTPESSVSGFLPGMSAATIAGHCHRDLWAAAGDATPVAEEAMLMLGVREFSPEAERERLDRSAVRTVAWREGRPEGDVDAALDDLAGLVEEVYLHVDNDAFDPATAPGIVDELAPGGLSLDQMAGIVRGVAARFRIRAAALTTFTPDRDEDDRTLRAGLRVLDLLGDHAAGRL